MHKERVGLLGFFLCFFILSPSYGMNLGCDEPYGKVSRFLSWLFTDTPEVAAGNSFQHTASTDPSEIRKDFAVKGLPIFELASRHAKLTGVDFYHFGLLPSEQKIIGRVASLEQGFEILSGICSGRSDAFLPFGFPTVDWSGEWGGWIGWRDREWALTCSTSACYLVRGGARSVSNRFNSKGLKLMAHTHPYAERRLGSVGGKRDFQTLLHSKENIFLLTPSFGDIATCYERGITDHKVFFPYALDDRGQLLDVTGPTANPYLVVTIKSIKRIGTWSFSADLEVNGGQSAVWKGTVRYDSKGPEEDPFGMDNQRTVTRSQSQ